MRQRLPAPVIGVRAALVLGMATLTAGCVRPYVLPTPDQPHATLKVRRVYERTAGTRLDETCEIQGRPALTASVASEVAQAPRADAFLVQPRPARIQVTSSFVHREMRSVQEPYTVQVPYSSTEMYSCGFGKFTQLCSRMVTNYRSETRYRWVTREVDVVDGSCSRAFALAAEIDHVYLVDFTYRDKGVCSAICVEQLAAGDDGSFENQPCPLPSAQAMRDLDTN